MILQEHHPEHCIKSGKELRNFDASLHGIEGVISKHCAGALFEVMTRSFDEGGGLVVVRVQGEFVDCVQAILAGNSNEDSPIVVEPLSQQEYDSMNARREGRNPFPRIAA